MAEDSAGQSAAGNEVSNSSVLRVIFISAAILGLLWLASPGGMRGAECEDSRGRVVSCDAPQEWGNRY